MKKYDYYILIEGLNLDRLFRTLSENNITMFDYNRLSYKQCSFGLTSKDYAKVKRFKLLNGYEVNIKKTYKLGFFLSTLTQKIGLYLGLVLSIAICLFISKITFKIDILGLKSIKEDEILSLLNNIDVKTNKINTATNEYIEQYLKLNNDKISLVSVVKKGTNLIVNIKEKIVVENDVSNICAPYNLLINSIDVVQGETDLVAGDIVSKGDILVRPKSVITSNEQELLQPIATINATTWITGQVIFKTEDIEYVKTGKKIVWSSFDFNNKKIFSTTPTVKFETYEKSVYNDYVFKNMFLPIKLNRTIFYETKAKTIKRDFESNKEKVIKESVNIAYKKLPKGVKVENEKTDIVNNNGTYFVTTYLQINLTIKG